MFLLLTVAFYPYEERSEAFCPGSFPQAAVFHGRPPDLLMQVCVHFYTAAVRPVCNTAAGRRIKQQGTFRFQTVQDLRRGMSVAVYSSSESDTIPLWSKDSPPFIDEKVKIKGRNFRSSRTEKCG